MTGNSHVLGVDTLDEHGRVEIYCGDERCKAEVIGQVQLNGKLYAVLQVIEHSGPDPGLIAREYCIDDKGHGKVPVISDLDLVRQVLEEFKRNRGI